MKAARERRTMSAPVGDAPNQSRGPVTVGRGNLSLVRGSILGAAAARASAKKATLTIAQPFRTQASRREASEQTDREIAELLFETCTKLRGVSLKIAQVLATESELIPPAYRRELARACDRVPPINRALAHKIVVTELGAPNELFAQFDLEPFAAASLGQVHAATSRSGQALAVKIQYPGVARGVSSDLAMLRALLRPTRFGRQFSACFDEVAARFEEELDYEREAANTAWFRENLRLAGVVVPEVHPELSTRRVLTTTRLQGKSIETWLATSPSQAERNRFGQLLVDLFHRCTFDLGVIHADPNFGNYLFRDDGSLGMLDFGCVKHIEPQFARAMHRVLSGERVEPAVMHAFHQSFGVTYRRDLPRRRLYDYLDRWVQWIRMPYQSECFEPSAMELFFALGSQLGKELDEYVERHDGAFIYFGRAQHGLYRFLQRLGATVRMSNSIRTAYVRGND